MTFTDELQRELECAIPRYERRRRRRTIVLGTAVMAGVVGVVWSLWPSAESELEDVATAEPTVEVASGGPAVGPSGDIQQGGPDPSSPTVRAEDEPPVPGGPAVVPDAGPDFDLVGTVTVWTGSELFVWGGSADFGSGTTTASLGVIHDPLTQAARPLPAAPGGPQSEAAGVWTGSEVLLCCGTNQGAALGFDPETNTWRELPDPPLAVRGPGPAGLWAGGRFVVLSEEEMVAYEPASNSWEVLAEPPTRLTVSPGASVVAAGETQLVLWPRPSARSAQPGFVYDFETDSWSQLPDPPEASWPAVPDLAWTGEELIVVGGLPASVAGASERLVGARLDWSSMTWRSLPDVWPEPQPSEGNLGSQSVVWTGSELVVFASSLGSGIDPLDTVVAAYDPATDLWRRLPSLPGLSWHPPAVLAGPDRILATIDGALHTVDLGVEAAFADPWAAASTPEFDDLTVRGVDLTLVGSNGNGADIVVLDLDLGLRTIYLDDQHHSIGPGGLTDMAMGRDRSLYIWRWEQPTLRFDAGPAPWGGRGSRLSFGELAQPPTIAGPGGNERFVLPTPDGGSWWSWEAIGDLRRATLMETATGNVVTTIDYDGTWDPVDVSSEGSLVITDGEISAAIYANGRVVDLGAGELLLVAADEVLTQTCASNVCTRSWVEVLTGRARVVDTNRGERWSSFGGPVIPGQSARLTPLSPDGTQVLVTVASIDDPGATELRRVDVRTGAHAVIASPDDTPLAVATWSRDGRHVVTLRGAGEVAITDLRSNTTQVADMIPDGYFILAAG